MRIKHTLPALSAIVSLAFPLSLTDGCAQQRSSSSSQQAAPADNNYLSYLSSLRAPSQLTLFGETFPMQSQELRERVEREFYWTLQQPAQLILNIKRSTRYFALFEKIFKEESVPDDCKYLAVAESALYMARSSKDAVGIWQFMDGTAKSYGLEVNDAVDERRHVEKSTRAAARFLKDAYKRFGSWTMAAAAYNMGIEGVKYNAELQGSTNYFDLYFNEETSRYVPRIAIIKQIMENASSYGLTLRSEDLYREDTTRVVKVYAAIDNLSEWARSNGSNYKDLKLLNPWMLKNALPKPKNGFWEINLRK